MGADLPVRIDAGAPGVDIILLGDLAIWDFAIPVLRDHCEGPRREIAQTARQVRIRPVDQAFVSEFAVLAKYHLPEHKIPDGVDLEMVM